MLTLVHAFSDVVGLRVRRDAGEERRVVERPAVLAARRLQKRRQVGLGHVQA